MVLAVNSVLVVTGSIATRVKQSTLSVPLSIPPMDFALRVTTVIILTNLMVNAFRLSTRIEIVSNSTQIAAALSVSHLTS
jgi:hypothetical protein